MLIVGHFVIKAVSHYLKKIIIIIVIIIISIYLYTMKLHVIAQTKLPKSGLRTFARKTSTIQILFIFWQQSDNELPMSEMLKNWGVTDFIVKIKHVENSPNFDKSALATRHGLSAC